VSDTLFQPPKPFDLVRGVPRDLLDTPDNLDPGTFLRLDADLLDSDQMADCIDLHKSLAVGVWIALLTLAKQQRQFGILDLKLRTLSASINESRTAVLNCVLDLERVGLVWLDRQDGKIKRVRIRQWMKYQTPTDRERQQLRRARESTSTSEGVTDSRDTSRIGVTSHAETRQPPVVSQHRETGDKQIVQSNHARTGPPAREATQPSWWQDIANQLTFIHQNDPAVAAHIGDRIIQHATHPHRRGQRDFSKDAYRKAATALAKKFDSGWRPDDGARGAIAYYLTTIASHSVDFMPLPEPAKETHTNAKPIKPKSKPVNPKFAAFD
jgi:hypothetical protein